MFSFRCIISVISTLWDMLCSSLFLQSINLQISSLKSCQDPPSLVRNIVLVLETFHLGGMVCYNDKLKEAFVIITVVYTYGHDSCIIIACNYG